MVHSSATLSVHRNIFFLPAFQISVRLGTAQLGL